MYKNNNDTIYSFYINSVYESNSIRLTGTYSKNNNNKWMFRRDSMNFEIGKFKRIYPKNKFLFGLFDDTLYYKKYGVWERVTRERKYQIDYGKKSYIFQSPKDTIW